MSRKYRSVSLSNLRRGTEYELWLLEAVYDIVDQRLAVEGVDELVYPRMAEPRFGQTMERRTFAFGTGGVNS